MSDRIFSARPPVLKGTTDSQDTTEGRVYVTVNFLEGKPVEVFVIHGRAGSQQRACTEALGRLCSVALQRGISLRVLTKQLRGISSETTMGLGPNKVLSVPDAVGRVLDRIGENNACTEPT